MNVIGISSNFNWRTFEIIADAAQVTVKFWFDSGEDKWLPVLRAEHDVQIIFNKRLCT